MLALLLAMTIPVYPGARLEPKADDCCTFITTDALSKVTAFYEKALGKKAYAREAYFKAFPQLAVAQRELPQDKRDLRIFILETEGPNPTHTFGLVQLDPKQVAFEIEEAQLGGDDARFAWEHRQAHGQTSQAEQAKAEFEQAVKPADPARYSLPVFPGALLEGETWHGPKCWEAQLVTTAPFEKVVAFYKEKLKGKLREFSQNGQQDEMQWLDNGFFVASGFDGPASVNGRKGAQNRYVSVSPADSNHTVPLQDPKTKVVVDTPAVVISMHHATLEAACVKLPPGAPWNEGARIDPDGMYGVQLRE